MYHKAGIVTSTISAVIKWSHGLSFLHMCTCKPWIVALIIHRCSLHHCRAQLTLIFEVSRQQTACRIRLNCHVYLKQCRPIFTFELVAINVSAFSPVDQMSSPIGCCPSLELPKSTVFVGLSWLSVLLHCNGVMCVMRILWWLLMTHEVRWSSMWSDWVSLITQRAAKIYRMPTSSMSNHKVQQGMKVCQKLK